MNAIQTITEQQMTVAEPKQDLAAQSGGSLLNFVALAVSDPNVDVAKLEALLRMQREIVSDDARAQFNAALHAAQTETPRVQKNGRVDLGTGKGGYDFATWEDMDAALRPVMQRHGFSLSFDMTTKEGGGAVVIGTLLHSAGHSKTASVPLALDSGAGRNNLQAMGSTLSYGKRYVAEMLFNIVRVGHDDDSVRGGMLFIAAEQKEKLVALMQEVKADTVGFLRYMGVDSLDEIETKNFTAAVNALMAKKKPKAAP